MSSTSMPLGSWTGDRLIAAAVGVAAGLLLTIAYLTKRIASQAADVEETLSRTRKSTRVIFDIPKLSAGLERMTAELRAARTGAGD